MKFLENIKLEQLSSALTRESTECFLDVKAESYSCKMVIHDKKMFKKVLNGEKPGESKDPQERQALSPPTDISSPWSFSISPNTTAANYSRSVSGSDPDDQGPSFCDSISLKTLFHLTTLMNNTFGDYDFTDANGESFCRYDLPAVHKAVDGQLSSVIDSFPTLRDEMWSILDEEIRLKECTIYSYKPDYLSDPFSENGCIWSFNFFFHNKKLKRILFFSCRALSSQDLAADMDSSDGTQWNLDD